jgi:elongator complex protein 4
MRKRFVIETLHLDIEGGVIERRTAPPTGLASVGATVPSTSTISDTHFHTTASVEAVAQTQSNVTVLDDKLPPAPKGKPKKSVAFRSDWPELYDF